MAPPSRVISRAPVINRKSALEPTRAMVRSGNCNSARESPPVLRAESPLMTSPGTARRGLRQERNEIDRLGDFGPLKRLASQDRGMYHA